MSDAVFKMLESGGFVNKWIIGAGTAREAITAWNFKDDNSMDRSIYIDDGTRLFRSC